jgi:hypothetical protein
VAVKWKEIKEELEKLKVVGVVLTESRERELLVSWLECEEELRTMVKLVQSVMELVEEEAMRGFQFSDNSHRLLESKSQLFQYKWRRIRNSFHSAASAE